jgi:hypothetical protein
MNFKRLFNSGNELTFFAKIFRVTSAKYRKVESGINTRVRFPSPAPTSIPANRISLLVRIANLKGLCFP